MSSRRRLLMVCGGKLFTLHGRTVRPGGAWENTSVRAFDGRGVISGLTMNNYCDPSVVYYAISGDSVTVRSSQPGYGLAFDVAVTPGTTYSLSLDMSPVYNADYVGIGEYTAGGEYIRYTQQFSAVTTSAQTRYITIVLRPSPDAGAVTYTNMRLDAVK